MNLNLIDTPDSSRFHYDEASGYYFDPATGYYYDPTNQHYYDSQNQQFLQWDSKKQKYVNLGQNSNTGATISSKTEPQAASCKKAGSKKNKAAKNVAKVINITNSISITSC